MIALQFQHHRNTMPGPMAMLAAGILAAGLLAMPIRAQSSASSTAATATGTPTHYQPNRFPKRASAYYSLFWGVDSLNVKTAESGKLVRFSYRVLDPNKSKDLNDKNIEPALILPAAHASLEIPSLEKVGKLRQTSTPEAGKSYWMAFSNPSRLVKKGDRVNIIIGNFHADGLIVE